MEEKIICVLVGEKTDILLGGLVKWDYILNGGTLNHIFVWQGY